MWNKHPIFLFIRTRWPRYLHVQNGKNSTRRKYYQKNNSSFELGMFDSLGWLQPIIIRGKIAIVIIQTWLGCLFTSSSCVALASGCLNYLSKIPATETIKVLRRFGRGSQTVLCILWCFQTAVEWSLERYQNKPVTKSLISKTKTSSRQIWTFLDGTEIVGCQISRCSKRSARSLSSRNY